MNQQFAIYAGIVWLLWVLSWWIAAFWRARSTKQAPRASYRWQLMLAFLGFVLLFWRTPFPGQPWWSIGPVLGWALVGVVATGAGFAWWARIHLGALWSGAIEMREAHHIVDTGPYRLVRHPIYTGLILSALGLAAIKATPLAMLGAALVAIGFALKAKAEERFLTKELPDYPSYARRVPMLVPGIHIG
jgi:protein-S-isoprenylcysteine O-methyltransferase Ste14